MKAVRFYEYGAPDVLRYEEVPDPVAHDGEVLVRVAATSVNPIDLKTRSGATKDRMPIDLPFIPGVDLAGTIVAIGAGVRSLRPGDRVMGIAKATYAELCVVAADNLALTPERLDFEVAAVLPLVNLTGDQLLPLRGERRPLRRHQIRDRDCQATCRLSLRRHQVDPQGRRLPPSRVSHSLSNYGSGAVR